MTLQLCDFVKHLNGVSIATRIRITLSRGETWAICAGQEGASSGHLLFHHGLNRPGLPIRPKKKDFPSQNSVLHCKQLFSKTNIHIEYPSSPFQENKQIWPPVQPKLCVSVNPFETVEHLLCCWHTVKLDCSHILITSHGCSQSNSYVTLEMGIWQ